ncbi:hypothetical protein D9M68_830680 [compost metagenome]
MKRDLIFIYHTTNIALFADVEQFRTESVCNIHHRRWGNFLCGQPLNNIYPCLWSQRSADYIFAVIQVRLYTGMLQEYFLFALQQLQAQVSCSQIAGNTDKVSLLCPRAGNELVRCYFAHRRHTDNQSFAGTGSIATDQVYIVYLTSGINAVI